MKLNKIKELHNKHNQYPEYKDFYLSYSYDRKSDDWVFLGYRCTKCGRLFKKDKTVPNHFKNCPEINAVRKYKTTDIDPTATVLTETGEVWKPFTET